MISIPLSDKPQCRHHLDADNCLLCGTKKLKKTYNVALNTQGSNFRPPPMAWISFMGAHESRGCRHNNQKICLQCEVELMKDRTEAVFAAEQERIRQAHVAAVNAHSVKLWDEIRREEFNARWPGGKCVHGVYLNEFYCGVCSLAIIDPDYNPNVYRTAINKGLSNARRVLRSTVKSVKDSEGNFLSAKNGEKDENVDFEDLKINVDLEVWKATKKYGSEMSAALAYTIARDTAQKFLADLIAEQTVLVSLALEFATRKDREDAERLLSQCEGVQALERLANDWRAKPDDRQTAQRLINEYGERILRFASLDDTVENENGEKGDISAAEAEIHEAEEQAKFHAPESADIFETHRPALAALVSTWRGDQRKVGEAMLAGGFNVRGVPGVSKSQASRLYSVVTRAFKALIAKAVTK